MAQGPTYRVKFRRRREGKTNYYRRRRLLLSRKLRLVIRRSNSKVTVQIIEAAVGGDMTKASAVSDQLRSFGWEAGASNLPAAYLTGLLAGRRAKNNGVEEAVLDIGLNPPVKGCRIYAALKGVLDAGVSVPHSDEALPDEERLSGKHIVKSFEYYSGQKEKGLMFSSVGKRKTAISGLPKTFASVKKAIMDASETALQAKAKRAVEAEVPKKKAVSRHKAERPAERVPRAVPRKPKPKKLIARMKGKKPKKEAAAAAPSAEGTPETSGASGTPTEGQ